MPAKWFKCPDGNQVEIDQCLENRGCRLNNRCATRPFLRLIGYDRKWRGVTPSSIGNGPRYLYLKAVTDYVIDPQDRVWAAFGTGTHGKLSIHSFTLDVLAEEELIDDQAKGIADVLDVDEQNDKETYVLYDYKSWGSYRLAMALGVGDVPVTDENGNPVYYKSGKNKGKPKKQLSIGIKEPELLAEELQLNRYRIFFEKYGFPITRMYIQAMPRDGGTYVAKNRGINKNLYMIPIARLDDAFVLDMYNKLSEEVDKAFETGFARKCSDWESWDGRRCNGFCEVAEKCRLMDELQGINAEVKSRNHHISK